MGGTLSLVTAWGLGLLLVQCSWPAHADRARVRWLKLWIALGVGLAVASCVQFLWLVVAGRVGRGVILAEGVMMLGLALVWRRRRRYPGAATPPSARERRGVSKLHRGLAVAGGLVCGLAGLRAAYHLGLAPHGGWDAIAMWNVRARFLFRTGADWALAFAPELPHTDYPLLLPGLVVRGWAYQGRETLAVPIQIAVAYAAGTVGLLYAGLGWLRTREQGWLGVLVLLSPPFFVVHAATQTADVPLGLYILLTLVLFCVHDALETDAPGLLILAGFTAAAAAWTKNEGAMFCAAAAAARFLMVARHANVREAARQVAWACAGALPVLLMLLYFRVHYAPETELISRRSPAAVVALALNPAQYREMGGAFLEYARSYDRSVLTILPLLVLYGAFAGRAHPSPALPGVRTAAVSLALMLFGYFIIYAAFSRTVRVHMQTSLDRLLLQLWPVAVWVLFLWVRPVGVVHAPARE